MQLPKYGLEPHFSPHTKFHVWISSNPPLPFNCICPLSVLWDPLQVANPSVRREKHPQQFSTSTTSNVCSLNTKLQSKQNIIQHTKQSLRVFCSFSTVSVCSIPHTPKPWPLRPRSREEETTAARHQHEQLLMYSASENLTGISLWSRESLKCESINLFDSSGPLHSSIASKNAATETETCTDTKFYWKLQLMKSEKP
jgi:hypothetical protein